MCSRQSRDKITVEMFLIKIICLCAILCNFKANASNIISMARYRAPPASPNTVPWQQELQSKISMLVRLHGFVKSQPLIKELVKNTEKARNIFLRLEVTPDGRSKILILPGIPPKTTLRTEPVWETDLKSYIRATLLVFGLEELNKHLEQTIRYIEIKNGVEITDIDVDENGNIYVKYVPKVLNTSGIFSPPQSKWRPIS